MTTRDSNRSRKSSTKETQAPRAQSIDRTKGSSCDNSCPESRKTSGEERGSNGFSDKQVQVATGLAGVPEGGLGGRFRKSSGGTCEKGVSAALGTESPIGLAGSRKQSPGVQCAADADGACELHSGGLDMQSLLEAAHFDGPVDGSDSPCKQSLGGQDAGGYGGPRNQSVGGPGGQDRVDLDVAYKPSLGDYCRQGDKDAAEFSGMNNVGGFGPGADCLDEPLQGRAGGPGEQFNQSAGGQGGPCKQGLCKRGGYGGPRKQSLGGPEGYGPSKRSVGGQARVGRGGRDIGDIGAPYEPSLSNYCVTCGKNDADASGTRHAGDFERPGADCFDKPLQRSAGFRSGPCKQSMGGQSMGGYGGPSSQGTQSMGGYSRPCKQSPGGQSMGGFAGPCKQSVCGQSVGGLGGPGIQSLGGQGQGSYGGSYRQNQGGTSGQCRQNLGPQGGPCGHDKTPEEDIVVRVGYRVQCPCCDKKTTMYWPCCTKLTWIY